MNTFFDSNTTSFRPDRPRLVPKTKHVRNVGEFQIYVRPGFMFHVDGVSRPIPRMTLIEHGRYIWAATVEGSNSTLRVTVPNEAWAGVTYLNKVDITDHLPSCVTTHDEAVETVLSWLQGEGVTLAELGRAA